MTENRERIDLDKTVDNIQPGETLYLTEKQQKDFFHNLKWFLNETYNAATETFLMPKMLEVNDIRELSYTIPSYVITYGQECDDDLPSFNDVSDDMCDMVYNSRNSLSQATVALLNESVSLENIRKKKEGYSLGHSKILVTMDKLLNEFVAKGIRTPIVFLVDQLAGKVLFDKINSDKPPLELSYGDDDEGNYVYKNANIFIHSGSSVGLDPPLFPLKSLTPDQLSLKGVDYQDRFMMKLDGERKERSVIGLIAFPMDAVTYQISQKLTIEGYPYNKYIRDPAFQANLEKFKFASDFQKSDKNFSVEIKYFDESTIETKVLYRLDQTFSISVQEGQVDNLIAIKRGLFG